MSDRATVPAAQSSGAPDPLVGRVINDRFKVTALIARGGMGRVYRAEQAPLGRVCAIKVLNPAYAAEHDPEFHKRFFLEASVASKLTHPNTVTVFDYGKTDDDIYYMAMEYLEGHTLHRAIREAGHLPEERAAHIARQVCRALREAHSLGAIHRDLKPANIFLVEHGDEADFVKVLDFGLVKNVDEGKGEDLTKTGLFMGSPKYMSPEQIRGDKVDARTDVYALGIILYEMLTGKVPFDRPTSVNILMAHVHEEPPPLREMNPAIQVSPAMEELLARCLAKDPERRFRSMDEVLAALKRVGGTGLAGTISGAGSGEYRPSSLSGSGARLSSSAGGSGVKAVFPASSGSDPGSVPSPLSMPSGTPVAGAGASSQEGDARGPRGMVVAAVVGVAAIGGILAYVALRPAHGPTATPAATAQTSSAAAVATTTATAPTAAPTAAPAPSLVKVRVNTDPDGASVKEEGVELCTSTPCDILYKGSDADPTRDHKLTFSRPGYRAESRSVKVTDTPVQLKLTPAPASARPGPSPQKADTPSVPTGYKTDIPY